MTKTQANEPGFVLDAAAKAIYECKGLHLSTGRPWESATAADRYYCLEYAGAALAAAPSVPSPAYEGVKADGGWIEWAGGEQPVSDDTEGLLRVEDGDVIYSTKLGSFNFAHDATGPYPGRRIVAYRVLSPLAVEEADAKVGETASDATIGRDFLNAIEASRYEYPWLADWTPAERYGELIGDLLDIAFPFRAASADAVRDAVRKALLFSNWAAGEGICSSNPSIADPDDFMGSLYTTGDETPEAMVNATLSALAAAPSTPSPQIGKAGAGPVGEAVAQFRTVGCSDWYDGLPDNEDGGGPYEVRTLYARPVEGPGEVERQRGWIYFNPDAGTEWAESHPVESGEVHDAEDIRPGTAEELLKQLLPAWRELATETSRRETAEASLAEARERLEKVEAAAWPLAEIADEYSPEEDDEHQVWKDFDALGASLPLKRFRALRAALTGDAQEAGR